jgi:glucose/mannose transport system substrate-binding protein
MRTNVKTGILLAGVGLLAACGSSDDVAPAPVSIELATWWTSGAEVNAINALIDVHKKTHPDVTIKALPAENAAALQSLVTSRLGAGNPPAAFQANLGGSALQWGPNAQSLNSVSGAWASNFEPSVLEQLTYQGALIGVPVALTRQNVAYWNLKVINTISPLTNKIPSTIAEFNTWLTEVAAAGYTHPLCFGGKDSWVVAHVMFEDIVPSVVGAAVSKKFWSGNGTTADLTPAFDFAKSIQKYLVTNWADMGMADGIDKVMLAEPTPDAQCLMTSMGDWGGAQLAGSNAVGMDFTGTGWPGQADSSLVVFGGDTFVAARGAANQAAVYDFFTTMASEAGQTAFGIKKGSMAARNIPLSAYDEFSPLTKANATDYLKGNTLAGFKVIGSSNFSFDTLATILVDFFKSGDSTAVVTYLNDNYSSLKQ